MYFVLRVWDLGLSLCNTTLLVFLLCIILKAPPKAACFKIVIFVPPVYDDNVKLMLCLFKGVFYFWFVLLIAYFDYFLDNQTEKFGRNGNSLEMWERSQNQMFWEKPCRLCPLTTSPQQPPSYYRHHCCLVLTKPIFLPYVFYVLVYPVCLNFKVRDGCDVGRRIDMILTLLDKFLFSIFNFLNNKKKFKSKSICFFAKQK